MRTKVVNGEHVNLTIEEETARDAEEAAIAAQLLPNLILATVSEIDDLRDAKKSLPILTEGYEVDAGDLDVGTMATKIYASTLNGTEITSITNSGGIATATTDKNHHQKTGSELTISGWDQPAYNVTEDIIRTGPREFTYPISGTPAPGTGNGVFSANTMRFIPTDNQITFVNETVYTAIYLDVEEYVDSCQVNARELKNAVLACTTVAEVDAIDINLGWPDTGI